MPDNAAGAILGVGRRRSPLGPLVSGGRPFHVALGEAPDGLAFAIAMKLGDLDAVRSALVEGETARYRGDDVDGMIRLVPREGASSGLALAVSWSGYLVLASSAAMSAPSAPTRRARCRRSRCPRRRSSCVSTRPRSAALARSAPDFAAKATALLANIGAELAAARGRREPPSPRASRPASATRPPRPGDLAEARIDADADDAQLEAVATLVPKPGDNGARRRLAAIHPADASALLDAPREALATLFWSDTAETRADDASTIGPCVGKALAPILGPGGGTKLAELLAAWARGRGDWETASFVAKPSLAGLVLRAPVSDAAAYRARWLASLVSRRSPPSRTPFDGSCRSGQDRSSRPRCRGSGKHPF